MIRAIRLNAMAQDDATIVSGWNVAPNVAYVLLLLPGASSCGVFLFGEDGVTLVASGAALVGTDQPCILIPQTGQTIGMVDEAFGWHLLLTTAGTESQRTIRLGPAVDLPDEIHPVYGDDSMALARATAAIDAAAHYIDDVTVACPLGLGGGLGDVVSVPVDGAAVVGQVGSITWTATPDETTEQAVIRRHVAIAPEAAVEIMPPTVADDTGAATHMVGTSGNVLANDDTGLTVTAVNGLSANVGIAVDGNNGGSFTISANGSWTFDPDGDFALLEGSETADTSITYHASDGTAEAMATLTVTVSHANTAPVAVDDTGETDSATTTSGNVLANDTDADGNTLAVSQVAGSAGNVGVAVAGSSGGLFTISADGSWTFDPDGDFGSLTGEQTATTSVSYHVSDGVAEDEGTLTVTVSAPADADPYWNSVVLLIQPEDGAVNGSTTIIDRSPSARTLTRYGDTQVSTALGDPTVLFDGSGDYITAAHDSVFNFNSTCTLEFIDTFSTLSKLQALLTKLVTGNYSSGLQFILRTDGSLGFTFYYGTGLYQQVNSAAGAIVAGNTYHVALTRTADHVVRLHLNGAYIGQVALNSSRPVANTATLVVAREPGNTARDFSGHMRIRWTAGVARYGTNDNFTPPTKFQAS